MGQRIHSAAMINAMTISRMSGPKITIHNICLPSSNDTHQAWGDKCQHEADNGTVTSVNTQVTMALSHHNITPYQLPAHTDSGCKPVASQHSILYR